MGVALLSSFPFFAATAAIRFPALICLNLAGAPAGSAPRGGAGWGARNSKSVAAQSPAQPSPAPSRSLPSIASAAISLRWTTLSSIGSTFPYLIIGTIPPILLAITSRVLDHTATGREDCAVWRWEKNPRSVLKTLRANWRLPVGGAQRTTLLNEARVLLIPPLRIHWTLLSTPTCVAWRGAASQFTRNVNSITSTRLPGSLYLKVRQQPSGARVADEN